MAAPMAWQAECMRDDGSFGAWLRPWRIVPEFVFTFTFTVFLCCGLYMWFVYISVQDIARSHVSRPTAVLPRLFMLTSILYRIILGPLLRVS